MFILQNNVPNHLVSEPRSFLIKSVVKFDKMTSL